MIHPSVSHSKACHTRHHELRIKHWPCSPGLLESNYNHCFCPDSPSETEVSLPATNAGSVRLGKCTVYGSSCGVAYPRPNSAFDSAMPSSSLQGANPKKCIPLQNSHHSLDQFMQQNLQDSTTKVGWGGGDREGTSATEVVSTWLIILINTSGWLCR